MAEGYHTVKKYERADGSAKPTVEAALEGRGLDTPYVKPACGGALQICDISVVKLLDGPAEIYGMIKLHHPYGQWTLYNRSKNNPETIKVPGPLEVMLPKFGILPYDPVPMKFNFGAESGLKEMNEEFLSWMPEDPYDKIRLFRFEGKKSIMEVRFIAFRYADLADIEIFLDEEQEIYGTITASFSKTFEDLQSFPLFNKKGENGSVRVKAGEPIPLLRSFIALPHGDGFDIVVDLDTVSGAPVARGTIRFRPDKFGKWVGVLGKKDDEIQVTANVAFCTDDSHEATIAEKMAWIASVGLTLVNGQFVEVGGGNGLGESTCTE